MPSHGWTPKHLAASMPYGLCAVCDHAFRSPGEMDEHERLHGERRCELAKARKTRRLLARVPRNAPERPWMELIATPRVGLAREQRLRQNLGTLNEVLDRGGADFFRKLAALTPPAFQEILKWADEFDPPLAARLRTAAGVTEPASPSSQPSA